MTVRLQHSQLHKKATKPSLRRTRQQQKQIDRFGHIQPQGSWEIPRKTFHYSIGSYKKYVYVSLIDRVKEKKKKRNNNLG